MCVHATRPDATGPGAVGVHSLTGQVGLGIACGQSLATCIHTAGTHSHIGCNDITNVHSCTACAGIAGVGRVGAHPVTGMAGPGVHVLIVCIGVGGAYTGIARVTAGCVAACRVYTD